MSNGINPLWNGFELEIIWERHKFKSVTLPFRVTLPEPSPRGAWLRRGIFYP